MGWCQRVEQLQRDIATLLLSSRSWRQQSPRHPVLAKYCQGWIVCSLRCSLIHTSFFLFFFFFYPAGFSFQPDPKEERRIFFLTSHLPFAWLHKCASVPLLMTCSITDKHLLICPPGKWAGRLLTPLRLILQLLEYCWTTHMNVQEEWQDCGLHMDTQLLFTSGICQISMLEKPA